MTAIVKWFTAGRRSRAEQLQRLESMPVPDPLREQFEALERGVMERERAERQAACSHPHPFVWTYGARATFCPLCFWDGAA